LTKKANGIKSFVKAACYTSHRKSLDEIYWHEGTVSSKDTEPQDDGKAYEPLQVAGARMLPLLHNSWPTVKHN